MTSAWAPGAARELLLGPPLFDGCAERYLDLGSNVGSVMERLLLSHARPANAPSPSARSPIFSFFENVTKRSEICVIGFEPNGRNWEQAAAVGRRFVGKEFRVTVLKAAVGGNNSQVRVYGDGEYQKHEWGSSMLRWRPAVMTEEHSTSVPLVSFEWLLRNHVLAASPAPSATRLYVKMDIEGGEFDAFPPALESGALCAAVDGISVEVHGMLLKRILKLPNTSRLGESQGSVKRKLQKMQTAMAKVNQMHRSGTCRTHVRNLSPWGS